MEKRSVREASVKCPACGHQFVVRETKGEKVEPEVADQFITAIDDFFKTVEEGFKKVFDSKFWKL